MQRLVGKPCPYASRDDPEHGHEQNRYEKVANQIGPVPCKMRILPREHPPLHTGISLYDRGIDFKGALIIRTCRRRERPSAYVRESCLADATPGWRTCWPASDIEDHQTQGQYERGQLADELDLPGHSRLLRSVRAPARTLRRASDAGLRALLGACSCLHGLSVNRCRSNKRKCSGDTCAIETSRGTGSFCSSPLQQSSSST